MSDKRPRLLIEDWLPAAAIGVECMRERGSASALAPHTYLHVWWARRPLCVSRAAVLGSLLPAKFPRDVFERLIGFGKAGSELVRIRALMDTGYRVEGGFDCDRAFKAHMRDEDLAAARKAAADLWGTDISVIDPMAGGGSIPLESARLGFKTFANEYNPVACSVLEATVDYSIRFGPGLANKARLWGKSWLDRVERRIGKYYPAKKFASVHAYIFARTVPCPETQHATPLVPDWHLLKSKSQYGRIVAAPIVDKKKGTWTVQIRELGRGKGELTEAPPGTYSDGKGISLFTGLQIPAEYIKAKAQSGDMKSVLYAIAVKTPQGLAFQLPEQNDLESLEAAAKELHKVRATWEQLDIIPTEEYPPGTSDERPRLYGMGTWADMFAPRQLLCQGVLVEELKTLSTEIRKKEGAEVAEAILLLLAFVLDKFGNHNCYSNRFENTRGVVKGKMDRHDYAFKPAFAELAPCNAGSGFAWAIENVTEAFEKIAELPRSPSATPVEINMGSATSIPHIETRSISAVVVDPPYADNVQYSELADFFYVWLKRTQGHRHADWYSTRLCDRAAEAVVNTARHSPKVDSSGKKAKGGAKDAKKKANEFYQHLMLEVFQECHRVLVDAGALTVMFTHKKQEAWESLFTSLIGAGFTISATWPVKTESEHSLHQARKNAAQSTVVLVARKRTEGAGVGYFDSAMQRAISVEARATAERLRDEGLNPVDQLVGSFGPAMEVYSKYTQVKTDTGELVGVDRAIDEASKAVMEWRVEQLASRGLDGVAAEGQFALLCWDVLGALEFRFNEAMLLGKAVGMDVEQLVAAGLVSKSGDKIQMIPASERRRDRALEPDEVTETLFGAVTTQKKHKKKDVLKIHPNDPAFRTAFDACQALALRFNDAKGGSAGIGSAKALVHQQKWNKTSAVARLMEALVHAAPVALRFEKGKSSAAAKFPEFRAWHALLEPLFGVKPPEWKEKAAPQGVIPFDGGEDAEEEDEGEEADE